MHYARIVLETCAAAATHSVMCSEELAGSRGTTNSIGQQAARQKEKPGMDKNFLPLSFISTCGYPGIITHRGN